MNCPKCGSEYTAVPEQCFCGHVFARTPVKLLSKGRDEDAHPAYRLQGPFRTCAKCSSVMALFREENVYLNGLIPTGTRYYFRCTQCGKEIKVRSLWRNLLALPGCFLFAIFLAVFLSSGGWAVGAFAAILALYPLMLGLEIATRIRYPSVAGPD
jgi:hypothetical protein